MSNSKKLHLATKLLTSEDKAMEISVKRKSDVNFTKKIQGQRVRNGQKEFFIKWQNFLRSKLAWEPEENISTKAIIDSYFKES